MDVELLCLHIRELAFYRRLDVSAFEISQPVIILFGLLGLAWIGWWVATGGIIHGDSEDYLLAALGFVPLFAAVYLLKGW
jgi:hypothetical protein